MAIADRRIQSGWRRRKPNANSYRNSNGNANSNGQTYSDSKNCSYTAAAPNPFPTPLAPLVPDDWVIGD